MQRATSHASSGPESPDEGEFSLTPAVTCAARTPDVFIVPRAPEAYTVEQYAICAFFTNYILIPRNDESRRGA